MPRVWVPFGSTTGLSVMAASAGALHMTINAAMTMPARTRIRANRLRRMMKEVIRRDQ